MDGAKQVVDAAVGLAFEYDPSALNLDQIEAERLADRRLEAATRHRLKLLQARPARHWFRRPQRSPRLVEGTHFCEERPGVLRLVREMEDLGGD